MEFIKLRTPHSYKTFNHLFSRKFNISNIISLYMFIYLHIKHIVFKWDKIKIFIRCFKFVVVVGIFKERNPSRQGAL